MKVFISWSGERSRKAARALRQWIPSVFQSIDPWMSEIDIKAGAMWLSEIMEGLQNARFGIVCITPDNQSAPWLHFEAGAIAKEVGINRVCPYLISLNSSQFKGNPLTNFQYKQSDKKGTWELVDSINQLIEKPLQTEILNQTFELWWPHLDKVLEQLPEPDQSQMTRRPAEDMIEEMLELVRHMARSTSSYQDFYNEYMLNIKYPKEYMEKLPEREAYVITMREGYGRSIREIADLIGMSQPYIRRILKQAKGKLHHLAQIDTESKST